MNEKLVEAICVRTGVPFVYDRIVWANSPHEVHPQILMSPTLARKELETLANLDTDKLCTKHELVRIESRLRLSGYVYAAHNGLFDEVGVRALPLLRRPEPLEEYGTQQDLKKLRLDASSLLGLVALTTLPHKLREIYTGVWTTTLTTALAGMIKQSALIHADLDFSADVSMTRFLSQHIGQASFVSPKSMSDYLKEILPYSALAGKETEVFNSLYTAYQLLHLPESWEDKTDIMLKVLNAQQFLKSTTVDEISAGIAEGRATTRTQPEWKIGNAIFKAITKLREFEPDIEDVPAAAPPKAGAKLVFNMTMRRNP